MTEVQATPALLTAEEFERLPDRGRRELVRGRIVEVSPTGWAHGGVCVRIIVRLDAHVRAHALGEVTTEVGFILGRDPDVVRGPDVAFVARHRVPSRDARGFVELAPDLAVEVLSPGDAYSEVREKVDEYLAAGVREVWLVDPRRRTVEVLRPASAPRVLTAGEALQTDLLPGLAIPLAELFPAA